MSFGTLRSGEAVVDRFRSHAATHELNGLLTDALARVSSGGRRFLVEVVDFGRPIGESICVATGPGDEIVFAARPGRRGLTRFVKNRKPAPCSSVVVILKRDDADPRLFVLVTAFIGGQPQPEPWDRNAFARAENPREAEVAARSYWSSHALVWGCEETIPGTETTRCPW